MDFRALSVDFPAQKFGAHGRIADGGGRKTLLSPGPGGWSIVPAGDGNGIFLPVPTVHRSGAKPPPMLIADTALYVLGVPKDDTAQSRGPAALRHADYAALTGLFAAANPDDPIAAQLAAFPSFTHDVLPLAARSRPRSPAASPTWAAPHQTWWPSP